MKTTALQYARALSELSQNMSASEQQKLAEKFRAFLKRRRDEKMLPAIVKKLQFLQDAESGIARASLQTAFPISGASLDALERYAKKLFSSKEVVLHSFVSKKLLGGFLLRAENSLFDASLKQRLQHIKKELV